MRRFDLGLSVFYWVGFWLLVFVGVPVLINLINLKAWESAAGVGNFAISIAILSAVGGTICAASWRDRSSNLGRIVAGILRWSYYWTFLTAALSMFPRECPIRGVSGGILSSDCEESTIFELIMFMPLVFIYTAIIGFLGNIIYAFLFDKESLY